MSYTINDSELDLINRRINRAFTKAVFGIIILILCATALGFTLGMYYNATHPL